MSHVITQSCCKDATCVPVCPADCIRPRPGDPGFRTAEMLYIDPRLCVDCGACTGACPVAAIVPDDELGPATSVFADLNRFYFEHGPGAVDRRTPTPTVPGRMRLAHEVAAAAAGPDGSTPGGWAGDLRVAVVGSGPAACFTVEEILARAPRARVSVIERLSAPWGLARFGVAPDHLLTRRIRSVFERVIADPRVTLRLGVQVGVDVGHDELLADHDAVVYGTGAPDGRLVGIPGEHLPGSYPAAQLVAWYNGHPRAAGFEPDLSSERAVVLGNGNVALDVARILTADPDHLADSEIDPRALRALRSSRIREVVVLGRRGPEAAAFTAAELTGLRHVPGLTVTCSTPAAQVSDDATALARQKLALIAELPERVGSGGDRRVDLRFGTTPIEVVGDRAVRGLRVAPTGGADPAASTAIACGLVLHAVGHRSVPVPGLPFDESLGRPPTLDSRIVDPTGRPVPGVYAVGWLKRGPSGVIGSNRDCARETVQALLTDLRLEKVDE